MIPLLVLAIRIFRMLQIPQWAAACDYRNRSEVVSSGRSTNSPFERPCIPWIVAGLCSLPVGNDKVIHKHQNRCCLNECPDCDDQVQCLPAWTGLVGVDASRHAQNSGYVHDIEGQVKADHKKPEMPFAEAFTEHSAGHLRVPVIESGKQREQDSANDNVMKVSDNEV